MSNRQNDNTGCQIGVREVIFTGNVYVCNLKQVARLIFECRLSKV